jgi:Methyltransferase domain
MHRFWNRFVKPIVETAAPKRLMEIGAEFGWNTAPALEYCRRTGARMEVIDPAPPPALLEVLARYPAEHVYHPIKSLEAIPRIEPVDLVLLDGDHNWHTVYNELLAIFRRAADAGAAPPIVIFHDIAWPYARRDMYYSPQDLDAMARHPYADRGMLPGQSELTENGLNANFHNALHEGGPRNGVLTGIEDFIGGYGGTLAFHTLPFFNGLGILVPQERTTPALEALIDSFYSRESLLETVVTLETDGMRVRADLASQNVRLTRQAEALRRAKSTIDALRAELKASKQGS